MCDSYKYFLYIGNVPLKEGQSDYGINEHLLFTEQYFPQLASFSGSLLYNSFTFIILCYRRINYGVMLFIEHFSNLSIIYSIP